MSKMPEKSPDIGVQIGAWLLSVKEQGVGGTLAFVMAYLRGRYNGGKFWRVVIDALMCAMIAWFIRDILSFVGLNTNLAYIASVFIGYLGTDFISSLLRKVIGTKTGTVQ